MIAEFLLLVAAASDPIAGVWTGTSLCQIKPSPCHDEQVVYRIANTGPRRYRIEAYKIVAGKEDYMGPLDMALDASGIHLTGSNRDRGGVEHPWLFTVRGNHMSGEARTRPGGAVFRLIELSKR